MSGISRLKERGVPGYLIKGWRESRWQRVARYRLGNLMRGNEYWRKEEERMCTRCPGGPETWRHVWEECVSWKAKGGWQEMMEKVLGEDGEGEVWMKELERLREGEKKGGREEE